MAATGFSAAAVRANLESLQARLRQREAEGADDDEILDLAAEANELRDELRNHESYPALWLSCKPRGVVADETQTEGFVAATSERREAGLWHLRGVLPPVDCAMLVAAVSSSPGLTREEEEGSAGTELVRRSDDLEMAKTLWDRVRDLLPASLGAKVAPAAEADLRTEFWPEFPWDASWRPIAVDIRMVYEQIEESGGALATERRLDTQEADDRDEGWRPMLSLLLFLGATADGEGGSGGVAEGSGCGVHVNCRGESAELASDREEDGSWTMNLVPGEAAMFVRGDDQYAYRLYRSTSRPAVVVHAKVLFEFEVPSSPLPVAEQ